MKRRFDEDEDQQGGGSATMKVNGEEDEQGRCNDGRTNTTMTPKRGGR